MDPNADARLSAAEDGTSSGSSGQEQESGAEWQASQEEMRQSRLRALAELA